MFDTTPANTPACTVRGHQHPVRLVSTHVQETTGALAFTWECPGGGYRWFQLASHNLDGRALSDLTRQSRPRHGWKS